MSDSDPESDRRSEAVVESEVGSDTDPGPEPAAEERKEASSEEGTGEGDEAADPATLRERLRSLGGRLSRSYSTIVVVAVVVGVVLAPIVAGVVSQGSSGTVAVVPLEGGIDGASAAALSATLERARSDPDIDAVVLLINSGGGGAAPSETMYFEASRTAEEMPVVSSVDAIAASGAYYAAVGSDRVFVKPASVVGSVGVLFTPPPELEPNDIILSTGPSKLSGASERGWRYKTEILKRAFLSAVVEERGDALEIPRERVATAELFRGHEAVQTGMADEIGGSRDAIEYAAAQAGLDSYDVTVLRPQSETRFITRSAYLASDAPNRTMVSARYFIGPEADNQYPNALLIPPGIVAEELIDGSRNASDGSRNSTEGSGNSTNGSPNVIDPRTGPPGDAAVSEVTHGR
jgi:protease-4